MMAQPLLLNHGADFTAELSLSPIQKKITDFKSEPQAGYYLKSVIDRYCSFRCCRWLLFVHPCFSLAAFRSIPLVLYEIGIYLDFVDGDRENPGAARRADITSFGAIIKLFNDHFVIFT